MWLRAPFSSTSGTGPAYVEGPASSIDDSTISCIERPLEKSSTACELIGQLGPSVVSKRMPSSVAFVSASRTLSRNAGSHHWLRLRSSVSSTPPNPAFLIASSSRSSSAESRCADGHHQRNLGR